MVQYQKVQSSTLRRQPLRLPDVPFSAENCLVRVPVRIQSSWYLVTKIWNLRARFGELARTNQSVPCLGGHAVFLAGAFDCCQKRLSQAPLYGLFEIISQNARGKGKNETSLEQNRPRTRCGLKPHCMESFGRDMLDGLSWCLSYRNYWEKTAAKWRLEHVIFSRIAYIFEAWDRNTRSFDTFRKVLMHGIIRRRALLVALC